MPFNDYEALQTAVLSWLARPGDPLVAPAVPDMVRLFEAEATRRLKVGQAERQTTLVTEPGNAAIGLPAGFGQMRHLALGNLVLAYVPPALLLPGSGEPRVYTIYGSQIRLAPTPDAVYRMDAAYQTGVPPLGEATPSNWLLESHPDAYLFGSLAEAEAYVGHDERIPLWLQRRDASFLSIETADRKLRWPSGLQIRVDGITGVGGGGAWSTGGAGVQATLAVRVVTPFSGSVVVMLDGDRVLYVTSGALDELTIRLPAAVAILPGQDEVEISFAAPVTTLVIEDATGVVVPGGPTNAYGPGSGLTFRYIPSEGWIYWE